MCCIKIPPPEQNRGGHFMLNTLQIYEKNIDMTRLKLQILLKVLRNGQKRLPLFVKKATITKKSKIYGRISQVSLDLFA